MTQEQALVPQFLDRRGNRVLDNILSVFFGVLALSLLAQIAIPLSWTPVPVTGQTFGVALISLMWGKKRGLAVVLAYLFIGAAGLPVFALGKSGFSVGPTMGYLFGMVLASYLMGTLSDLGWTKTFLRSWLAAFLGSVVVFSCGLLVLSFFVPLKALLMAGLLPFLPGDVVKTLLASFVAFQAHRTLTPKT